jgi:hypothetical protein
MTDEQNTWKKETRYGLLKRTNTQGQNNENQTIQQHGIEFCFW